MMTRKLKGSDIYESLKRENERLVRQLIVERDRIKRAIAMLKLHDPAITEDEQDDTLLCAIVDLFADYNID